MMCEECGIRPAKFHLMTITNDERTERNLCPVCMAKYQKQLPGIDFSNLAGILNSILEKRPGKENEKIDETLADLTCEQCGMTYAEFQKGGMLGCAGCYKTFKTPLDALMQRVHGNTQHAGRIPGSVLLRYDDGMFFHGSFPFRYGSPLPRSRITRGRSDR